MNAQLAPMPPIEPINLDDPSFVGRYGSEVVSAQDSNKVIAALESSPITALAHSMQAVLFVTRRSSLERKRGQLVRRLFSAITGNLDRLEDEAIEVVGRGTLDRHMNDAANAAARIQDFVDMAGSMVGDLQRQAAHLDVLVDVARKYMEANPMAGRGTQHEFQTVSHRDRFERRVAHLAALQVSHQMSIAQLRLAVGQATDMLDRFQELRDVLVPVYRQHQLATANRNFLSPEVSALAVKAHEAIQKSIDVSLKGLCAQQQEAR